ncbi:MAG: 30S ribosomal protein S5 [Candidatus Nanoarchaeia archaeon]
MALDKPNLQNWVPKTETGRKVKAGLITHIDQILDAGIKILEPEIVDTLLPDLTSELLEVGQSKGKFGGGKGSIWKQTQKKTSEGNTITFGAFAIVGNKNGYIGAGFGRAKETVPAREKALRKAKLSLIKIRRACGSWACGCKTPHSIPFKVTGKCGSITMNLMSAPRGTGLSVEKKCGKIITLAGIKDIYSKTQGTTATKLNLFKACFESLKQLEKIKINPTVIENTGLIEGSGQ